MNAAKKPTETRLMLALAYVAMAIAIVANVKKATVVILAMSAPGTALQTWDAPATAIALELGFAVFAYFLAFELRGKRRHLPLLVSGTLAMAGLSALANIAYFLRYGNGVQWWQPVGLGVAAPVVTVMTAVLAGAVSSIARQQAEDQVNVRKEEMGHELELAKQRTAQERAMARKAKAEMARPAQASEAPVVRVVPPEVPEVAPELPAPGGNGHGWTPELLLEHYPEAAQWSGRKIGKSVGISSRQGRTWRAKMHKLMEGD